MNPETENHNPEPSIPNCRDIISQLGPLDMLLGSVSYHDLDGVEGKPQQIRTSARVFKKMKLDLNNSSANQDNKDKKEEVKVEDAKPENTSKKLLNSLWTSEEKNLFFEALNEYGKDFDNIHTYMSSRLKKKGVAEEFIKTKKQIGAFYNRSYHKVIGHCKFSETTPKNAQELYALINFGEMRKKIGNVNKRKLCKLNELLHTGILTLRFKGKTIKIKTPMCRALRRLNKLDEKYDDLKLPTRVIVELKPKDIVSFLKVQSMAQNPRIRVALSLQKRLSSLISCMSNRWKSTEALIYDKAIISTNIVTKDCVPDQKTVDESNSLLIPLLRLSPLPEAQIELPSVDLSEYFTGQSICLSAFEKRKLVKDKIAEVKKEEKESLENSIKTEKCPVKTDDESANSKELKSPDLLNSTIEDVVNSFQITQETQDTKSENHTNNKVSDEIDKKEEKRLRIEQVRQGWTMETSGALTIGEMYLMFGSGSKLLLEYSWDSPKLKVQAPDEDIVEEKAEKENNLSRSLKKLLSIAKLHCNNKNPVKCPCGHICGSKSNAQFKKPMSTKIPKKAQAPQEHSNHTEKAANEDSNITSTKNDASNDRFFHNASNSPMLHLFTHLDTMQRLNPKCKSNRGRPLCRQLVVERKLVPNKSESKHQIVSMNIISQENTSESEEEDDANESPVIANQNNNRIDEDKAFTGLLLGDQPSNSSMSSGISKILKESEDQWLNPDVTDYSLSSLLGHLDCPSNSKTNQSSVGMPSDDTQLSQDVDAQLRTLLIETSVDYTAKFADLAAQVVDKK